MTTLVRRVRTTLSHSTFLRSVLVVAGGTAVGQVLVILATPVLTRMYSPEDFGLMGVYASILSILLVVASLRYELAIPLPAEEDGAISLMVISIVVLSGFSLVSGIGVWMFGPQVSDWADSPGLSRYLWLLPLGLFGAGLYQVLNYWAIREKAFGRIGRTKLSQNLGQLIVQVGCGLFHMGPLGLIAGQLVGKVNGIWTLARLTGRSVWTKTPELRVLGRTAYRYRRFPLITTWASLLNTVSLQVPVLLMTVYFGATESGFLSMSQRILGLPASLVGQAIGQSFLAEAAELRTQPEKLRRFTERTALMLWAISLPVFGTLVVAGRPLFVFFLGEKWQIAGEYAQILAPWFLFWLVSSPLSNLLVVREWQGASLFFTSAELTLRYWAIVFGARTGLGANAIALLSLSGILISVAATVWFFRAAYGSILRVLKPALGLVVVASVCLAPVVLVRARGTLLLLTAIVAALGLYYALAWQLGKRYLGKAV